MPQPYNLTNVTGSKNLYELTKASNELAGGGIGWILLFGTFILTFFSLKNYDTKRAMLASSFITATLSILLRLIKLVGDEEMYGSIVFSVAVLIIVLWTR